MTRREEIMQQAEMFRQPYKGSGNYSTSIDIKNAFQEGAEWADKTMIDKACKCYCDDICDKGRCGMCFHKYDGEYQVKNTFQYNECNELKFLRKAMEE